MWRRLGSPPRGSVHNSRDLRPPPTSVRRTLAVGLPPRGWESSPGECCIPRRLAPRGPITVHSLQLGTPVRVHPRAEPPGAEGLRPTSSRRPPLLSTDVPDPDWLDSREMPCVQRQQKT